jgi:hypothetical protein
MYAGVEPRKEAQGARSEIDKGRDRGAAIYIDG